MKSILAIGRNNEWKVCLDGHVIELIRLDNCWQYRLDGDNDKIGFISSLEEIENWRTL